MDKIVKITINKKSKSVRLVLKDGHYLSDPIEPKDFGLDVFAIGEVIETDMNGPLTDGDTHG